MANALVASSIYPFSLGLGLDSLGLGLDSQGLGLQEIRILDGEGNIMHGNYQNLHMSLFLGFII